MGKKVWEFTLKDGNHTVELEHGYFSGKRKITVDGTPVVEINRNIFDSGSMHPFQVSGVPCQLLIEPFLGATFKYFLYVDGKPVDGESVLKMERIRQMRNSLGMLNIYLWAFLFMFVFILIPIGMALGGWFIWSGGSGWERLLAVSLWLGSGALLFASKHVLPAYARDVVGGTTTLTGCVGRKWIMEEQGQDTQYGLKLKWKIFRFVVNGHSFHVSRRLYGWVSQGDEVVVHYWPRSVRVAKVKKLSA